MKPDIHNRTDIEKLIIHFYTKVKADAVIGFIFNETVQINWDHHVQVITDFWESILLDNPVYKNNAMDVHYTLNRKVPLQKIYFETWLMLFTSSVDDLYFGKIANMAKTRAKSIAAVMEFKMNGSDTKSIL